MRSRLRHLVMIGGLVALLLVAPVATAEPSAVALNEINCDTDWVEVVNRSNAEVSLAGWLLTDDPLDVVPVRDTHRMRFGAGAVLAPGARLVVSKGPSGFPFGLSCGDDTLSLADATDTLVDSYTLPAAGTGTLGRIPDGTGDWTVTVPTPGTPNVASTGGQTDDPAWLYDPLQVTEIDLEAGEAALAQLAVDPGTYVEARITLRNGGSTYGPYLVGLRLKGHAAFRPLSGKAAFKVKFSHVVAGQRFHGLKGLTLNNMVQDPSMIAEATTSLLVAATGAPVARVGYAYVRLNGADYGLYANVETVDAVMAARWSTGTKHIYEGDPGIDATPGSEGQFEVDEGSSTDLSDLTALSAANAGGTDGWWDRMQPVADLAEMTRTWAAEHYAGHWDGYSVTENPGVGSEQLLPAQRPRGPLLPHHLRHRQHVARPSGLRGIRQWGADAPVHRRPHLPAALRRGATPDLAQPGRRRASGTGTRDPRRDRPLAVCAIRGVSSRSRPARRWPLPRSRPWTTGRRRWPRGLRGRPSTRPRCRQPRAAALPGRPI